MAHILLVDDDSMIRKIISKILVEHGHSVIVAVDGDAALKKIFLGDISFDVIVTDLQMPKLNGIELLQALRNAGITTPIILQSSMTGEELRAYKRLGFARVIPKSEAYEKLPAAITEIISQRP